ncbi:acetyl-CoA carboxylase biotin carboxyl carrier protein [Alicyclobacillus sp.]|uniref:acetyl-CoA carboxylase biotin carboxyl carrier protein n=1 Tax=Alicyclobacillus sp. TaxID=61169 RepID=UPI0025BC4FB0|nr:acetyl-CoA carboxylase biotin carboxyl carrier protein [Alicyclobacillus sp.]MCL6516195.1 acetyl-CoA carboxylase biotin carboxyl carrier protein [Alicyclobacillus sp.]
MLKIGEIRELIRLLDDTSLAEIRIETEDMKLWLKKPEAAPIPVATPAVAPAAGIPAAAPAPSPAPQPAAAPAAETAPAPSAPAEAAEDETGVHIVKSPMVGTFYRAPAPDAPPYVEVGSRVTEKTVVCIVEAMKLMNEIEAEVTGEVVAVLAENGQLVEYGQPLFKIKRA